LCVKNSLVHSHSHFRYNKSMKTIIMSIYNIVLALWVGGMSIYTFMITPIIFKSYSKAMAGEIVGHLFGWYFKYNLILTTVALVLFFFIRPSIRWLSYLSALVLVLSFILNIVSVTVIHPKAKKIKQEINSSDSEIDVQEARKAFARVHGISMVVNLIIICAGCAMIVLTTYSMINSQEQLPGGL
jgi:hypothetical protein